MKILRGRPISSHVAATIAAFILPTTIEGLNQKAWHRARGAAFMEIISRSNHRGVVHVDEVLVQLLAVGEQLVLVPNLDLSSLHLQQ